LFGDCLEALLAGGVSAYDMLATAEGRALFNEMVEKVYIGLSNDFFDIAQYANHPLIAQAHTNGWWNQSEESEGVWNDWYDQQTATLCRGHITLIDDVKAEGKDHFNVEIADGDLDATKKVFTGSATELFRSMKDSATQKFRVAMKRRTSGAQTAILVTPSIYDRYEEQIVSDWDKIPESYRYFVRREGFQEPLDGVLLYKGIPVVCMDEWAAFDNMTGTTTHRAVMTLSGNMPVGYDTDTPQQQIRGNLRVAQSMLTRDKGRVDMFTAFKTSAALADTDFIVNASATYTP